jgi:hypothetical protein
MKRYIVLSILLCTVASCNKESKLRTGHLSQAQFNPATLNQEMLPLKMLRGQLLYLPVYSNVPYQIDTIKFDMSAFVAIHNTDLNNPIFLTKVLYFNQEGKLVSDFLKEGKMQIDALAAKDFYVPYEDQSGTGANFLIEWTSDSLVCEPLIESVTTCLKPNNSVAVLSQGKIIREKK